MGSSSTASSVIRARDWRRSVRRPFTARSIASQSATSSTAVAASRGDRRRPGAKTRNRYHGVRSQESFLAIHFLIPVSGKSLKPKPILSWQHRGPFPRCVARSSTAATPALLRARGAQPSAMIIRTGSAGRLATSGNQRFERGRIASRPIACGDNAHTNVVVFQVGDQRTRAGRGADPASRDRAPQAGGRHGRRRQGSVESRTALASRRSCGAGTTHRREPRGLHTGAHKRRV